MSSEETPGSTTGANLINKVKGAFVTTHGAGESIRGNAMDALDTAFGTRKPENVAATRRGEAEDQQGVSSMDSKYGAQTATGAGANTTTGSASEMTGSGPGMVGRGPGMSGAL
ncbi:hypothetical protein NEOLEDRAFT_346893 [Neolentinus lepideus HHB14362 ss-1]|uniref:Uncharacterized protein n=1 Tax=Neolentinus lepideus HHB14362 ss-1 TaxID=1314782 RepID=A0A165SQG5_9AGAM|nr:hypothetical protein NEOLEDRAFT_346893 [Neolentinus lepideus HHB14362 ss-1]